MHRLSLFSWRHCTSSHDCNEEVEKESHARGPQLLRSVGTISLRTQILGQKLLDLSFKILIIKWNLSNLVPSNFIWKYFLMFYRLMKLQKFRKISQCPAFVEIGLLKSDWVENGPNEETRAIIEVKFFSKGLLWFDYNWQVTGKAESHRQVIFSRYY